MEHVDVVIIGAGPVGLSSAIQFGRANVSCVVLERRATLSQHPKAGGIHPRTMEAFRQWGIADRIRALGPKNALSRWGWMTRLNGIELGRLEMGYSRDEQELFDSQSPEFGAGVGQDLYEPVLAETAASLASVQVRFGCEMVQFDDDGSGVTVDYVIDGEPRQIRASFVVGADGTRSATRRLLGIGEHGQLSLGDAINIRFKADMEPYRAGRNYGLYWIINAETQGAFQHGDGSDWRYNFEAAPGSDPKSYSHEECADLIRAAIGADIDVEILSILYWKHDQAVADRWREGRVFLVGDAAHHFPPHGGFGMNSGVQDSVNLVWKLIAALRWGAGNALLDTYETERKPVAEFNGAQTMINTRKMEETGWLVADWLAGDVVELKTIETDEGEPLRRRLAAAIPKQREMYFSQGQQFGQLYESSAIVPDGTEPVESTVSEYRPNARPGARAPHLWLHRRGRRISTIDLVDGGFVLLTGPEGNAWIEAVDRLAETGAPPTNSYILDDDSNAGDALTVEALDTALSLYGIGRAGAVLIRPDGQVAFRSAVLPESPFEALADALTRVLDMAPDSFSADGTSERLTVAGGK